MFLKPTDILKDEHVEIKRMLTILNIIIEKINYGEKISPKVLEKIINFFRIFTDRCHHWKEEKILFPSLEEVGIPRYGGPIGVMLMEHEEGRRYVKNMVEAVEKYRRGLEDALGEFKENAVNYVALLDQHIYKEDNILFNLADQHIPLSRQEEIMHSFKEFEERESKGEHEKQLQILKRLEVEYLRE